MSFCLLPNKIEEFKRALKEKEILLSDLVSLDHAQLVKKLEPYAGASADGVATMIEEKLILKNRLQGLKNVISKLTESGRYSPQKKEELKRIASEYKEKQIERVFSPKEHESFLGGVAEKMLGTEITKEEAFRVFELASKEKDLKAGFDKIKNEWKSKKAAAEYGAAKVIYEKYVENLKNGSFPLKDILRDYTDEIKTMWKENRAKAIGKVLSDALLKLSETTIATTASIDNSFLGRQGGMTLAKNPKIWWNMAKKSFSDIAKTLKGEDATDQLMAEIYSRPNYINGWYDEAKLFPRSEEQFPTSLPEKITYVGKAFKASEVAFKNSAIRARADLFDMMAKLYEKDGFKMDEKQAKDIGTLVNAMTARGKVGQIGSSRPVQLLMWAPKMLKADWDVLTAHTLGAGLETKFAKKQAARNIFNIIVYTAAIVAVAKALGAEVEEDPRSSDFMKIKVGNTTFNQPFLRGMPQIVTLFSRLLSGKTKSSQTKEIQELNSGEYGSKTMFDVGIDFLVNKTTPFARTAINKLEGRTITGEKQTLKSIGLGFLPISVQNFLKLKDDSSTQAVIGAFVDLFGIGSNTYTRKADLQETAKTLSGADDMAKLVSLYIKGFQTDPGTAIKTLFTKEQLKDVRGGAVIMERMGVDQSSAVKRKGGAGPTDKLDHTIPLELGGDNSMENLKIVTENEWKSYTPVENYLGKLLKDSKIDEKTAQNLIVKFKNKQISFEEIKKNYK